MSPISAEMNGNLSNEALNSSTNSDSTTGSKSILEDSNSGGSEADADGGNFIHSTCGGSGSFGGGAATFISKGYEGIEQPTSSTENYTYGPSSVESGSKFIGTLIPNRVFVGGISCQTTESELLTLFSQFGSVRGTKIIMDRAGVSKGYGFVTFETEDEVKNLFFAMNNREMPFPIVHRDRRLNIAPAVKKQQPMRPYESQGSSSGASSTSYEPFYCGQSTQGDFFVPPMLQSPIPQNATYGSQGYGVGLNSAFSPLPFDAYYYGQSNHVAPQMPLHDNFFQQSNGFTSRSLPQAGPFYTMQNPMGMGLGQAMPGPNGTIIFSTLPMY